MKPERGALQPGLASPDSDNFYANESIDHRLMTGLLYTHSNNLEILKRKFLRGKNFQGVFVGDSRKFMLAKISRYTVAKAFDQ